MDKIQQVKNVIAFNSESGLIAQDFDKNVWYNGKVIAHFFNQVTIAFSNELLYIDDKDGNYLIFSAEEGRYRYSSCNKWIC
jgi:hypothetical protein